MASFRTPLPLTFRVNMSGKFRESTRHKLERDLFPKMRLEVPGMAPPKCLAWYPDRLAWQIDIPKDALKKSERLRELHAFMVRANEVGALTRQEAVSMIPPLLLKVKPSHRVLDLCAAPAVTQLTSTSPWGGGRHKSSILCRGNDKPRIVRPRSSSTRNYVL